MKEYISYIFHKDTLGYISETKFQSEMDLDNPPLKGESIIAFYDEPVKFENIVGINDNAGNISFFEDNKLKLFSQDDLNKRVLELANDFYNMAKASNCEDLQGKNYPTNYPESNIEYLFEGLKKAGINVEDKPVVFNEEEYKNIQNEIFVLVNQSSKIDMKNSYHHFMLKMISGVNTLLAYDNIITPNLSLNRFLTYIYDEDESEHLDYGQASSTLRDLYFSTNYYIPKPKEKPKTKFKM
jgi:hypothetical protein